MSIDISRIQESQKYGRGPPLLLFSDCIYMTQ